jgi:hypothetical protein
MLSSDYTFAVEKIDETRDGCIPAVADEHLRIPVLVITQRHQGIRAAGTREPIRVTVLGTLQAGGLPLHDEAISNRQMRR